MRKLALIVTCVAVSVMIVGGVYAQFASTDDAIAYRKAAMFMISQHFKRMGAVVQGKADYDKPSFAANAAVVRMLATLPWEASLVPGSDKGQTTLNSAVFSKTDDFKAIARGFEAAAAKLEASAQSGNMDEIKAQFGAVAGSCKACHSVYRK